MPTQKKFSSNLSINFCWKIYANFLFRLIIFPTGSRFLGKQLTLWRGWVWKFIGSHQTFIRMPPFTSSTPKLSRAFSYCATVESKRVAAEEEEARKIDKIFFSFFPLGFFPCVISPPVKGRYFWHEHTWRWFTRLKIPSFTAIGSHSQALTTPSQMCIAWVFRNAMSFRKKKVPQHSHTPKLLTMSTERRTSGRKLKFLANNYTNRIN